MKKFVIALLVLSMLFSAAPVLAASVGSASDPLISLQYVNSTFIPDVVNAGKEKINSSLNAVYNKAVSGASSVTTEGTVDVLAAFYNTSVSLSSGSTFIPHNAGSTVTIRRGTVIDASVGSPVVTGKTLTPGHRYICCENTSATFTMAVNSTCAVSGVFTMNRGCYSNTYTRQVTPAFKRVVVTRQKLIFNGETLNLEVYNIDDENYFKMRDVAFLLMDTPYEISLDFNTHFKSIYAEKGGTYVPNGSEMKTGVDKSSQCVPSSWDVMVDGVYFSCKEYNIGGNNFFRIRDLAKAFGFGVEYDAKTNTGILTA